MAKLFEEDRHAWIEEQIAKVAAGQMVALDAGELLQYLEEMSNSERSALMSYMKRIIEHLLKCKWQPHLLPTKERGWRQSIDNARNEVEIILDLNPSMKKLPATFLQKAYGYAKKLVANDAGIDIKTMPQECPFTIDEVFDDDFYGC